MRISLITLFLFAATLHAGVLSSYTLSYRTADQQFDLEVTGEQVLKTPIWKEDADSPPLAPRKAAQLATAKFRQLISDHKNWKRGNITLKDAGDGGMAPED
jgi:hypothetical protein